MTSRGPLEFLVIGFPGVGLPQDLPRLLDALTATSEVRVTEAVLIVKYETGQLRVEDLTDIVELGETDGTGVAPPAEATMDGLLHFIDDDLVSEVAATMLADSIALALVLEHRVRDILTAFRAAGGVVLASTRMPDHGHSTGATA